MTKIAIRVNTLNIRSMQRTLNKLVALANSWDMDFNVNKCEVMDIGKRKMYSLSTRLMMGWSIQLMKRGILGC